MPRTLGRWALPVALLLAAAPSGGPAFAQAPTAPASAETEEEKRERETRTACAVAVCATLHKHEPASGQVSCPVTKTWRKEVLSKILARGKVSWPWGDTRCASEIRVDRALLV